MPRAQRILFSAALIVFSSACAKHEIVHELDEREANEIMVVLDQASPPISADKLPDVAGTTTKGARFMIAVPASEANRAWKLLNDASLPRKKDLGLGDVFSGGGLVPTASEEKAKMLQAIQGELSRTLKSIDGILDARVHVVIPEDSVLRTKEEDKVQATASVWYKYVPRDKKSKPLTDQEVAELVANGVEKLKPEQVKVIATPAMGAPLVDDTGAAVAAAGSYDEVMGIKVASEDARKFKAIGVGVVALLSVSLLGMLVLMARKGGGGPKTPPRGMAPRAPAEPPTNA